MNKKKIIAAVVAVSTMVAATFGTYAYFTANDSVSNSIVLTLGNLNVSHNETDWTYSSTVGGDNTDKVVSQNTQTSLAATQLRPGDKFTKTVTVTYTGNLTGNVRITKNADTAEPFVLRISTPVGSTIPAPVGNVYTINNVAPGTSFTFDVTLEVPTSVGNGSMSAASTFTVPQNLITVEATQANNPTFN